MNYSTYEELHNLIKTVVKENYTLASANIIYLEELDSKSFVIYMTQFRDAFTHLVNLYSTDVLANKEYVLEQLERVNGHLERIVIDSYRKICDRFLWTIRKTKRWRNIPAYELQIAQKIKALRMCEEGLTFDMKKQGFQELIAYMETILNKN